MGGGSNKHCLLSFGLVMDSLDIVHGLSDHCPWTPVPILGLGGGSNKHCLLSFGLVYGLIGYCPWTQWTLSMDPCSNIPVRHCPWTKDH